MERLRFLTRVDPRRVDLIAREAAETLLACAETAEVVVACRRLLDRHPACGPLWWVTATALTVADPAVRLLRLLEELDTDSTPEVLQLEATLDPDAVAIAAWCAGPDGVLAGVDESAAADDAHAAGREVLVGVGALRVLAAPAWAGALARLRAIDRPQAALIPWSSATRLLGTTGPTTTSHLLAGPACPVAPELLRPTR